MQFLRLPISFGSFERIHGRAVIAPEQADELRGGLVWRYEIERVSGRGNSRLRHAAPAESGGGGVKQAERFRLEKALDLIHDGVCGFASASGRLLIKANDIASRIAEASRDFRCVCAYRLHDFAAVDGYGLDGCSHAVHHNVDHEAGL